MGSHNKYSTDVRPVKCYYELRIGEDVIGQPISTGMREVKLYTDGACIGNPGPGGYGAVLLSGGRRKELSGGYRLTTNNRMELMAVIEGLEGVERAPPGCPLQRLEVRSRRSFERLGGEVAR